MNKHPLRSEVSDADLLQTIQSTVSTFLKTKGVRGVTFADWHQELSFHAWSLFQSGKLQAVAPSAIWRACTFRMADMMREEMGKVGTNRNECERRIQGSSSDSAWEGARSIPSRERLSLEDQDALQVMFSRCNPTDDTLKRYCEMTMRGLTTQQIADALGYTFSGLWTKIQRQKDFLQAMLIGPEK